MDLVYNLINQIDLNLLAIVFYALFCGAIFGIERRKKNKSIGIRTNIFVCLGSALFAYLSLKIPGQNDSSRVIAQIVTGIGFIGGGVIFRSNMNDRLVGITTASLLWVLASIGIMIGVGKGKEAAGITILIYIINILTYQWEKKSYKKERLKKERTRKKQSIKMNQKAFTWVKENKKHSTTRIGVRKFKVGEHRIVNLSHPNEIINILIKKVEVMKFKNIPNEIIKMEGYPTKDEFKSSLKNYYPHMKDNDLFTIIQFKKK